ncbi:MAG: SIMPL domain-containing protein [Deltaproteobacteria bacterium]|nr:SIMPL domain-containing protein [Deltaproteobacteria bacterium]
MKRIFFALVVLVQVTAMATTSNASGAVSQRLETAIIIVNGTGEIAVDPDRAVVRLGVVVQAEKAAEAQQEVNRIMERVLQAIENLGLPSGHIQTSGLLLTPIYERKSEVTRVVAYRSANMLRLQVDDLKHVGDVIDACIQAGANQLQGISFDIRDAATYRNQALQMAAQEARGKAEALAESTGVKLGRILEIREGGTPVVRPQLERFYATTAKAPTPVHPGQVRIRASVTVRYEIITQ